MSELLKSIHEHMNKLCLEIGSKHCGSEELKKAGEYVAKFFSDEGFQVIREELPVRGWDFRSFMLYDITEQCVVPASTACYFSNAAELTDVPLWIRQEDIDRLESLPVQGRLCFVSAWYDMGSVSGYNGLAERLDRLGAAAAIFLNRIHTQLAPSTKIERSPFLHSLGVAAVAHEGAIYMANHSNDVYYLKIDANCFDTTAFNVIARLGSGPRKGVIGAHYDTAPLIQGAQDNAGGTVMLMETAKAWKQRYDPSRSDWTFDFVAFTGEEYIPYDLPLGSGDYVRRHAKENIRFYLNIDDMSSHFSHPEVELGYAEKLPKLNYPYAVKPADFSGDDKSFHAIGVASIWIVGRKLFSEFHTALDDLAHTDFALMERGVYDYLDLLGQLTESKTWDEWGKTPITIRPASPADFTQMSDIAVQAWTPIHECYHEQLGDELYDAFNKNWQSRKREHTVAEAETGCSFVAECDGRVVGFANYSICGEIGELLGNAVDPAYGRHGIGTMLQSHVLEYLKNSGCSYAFVETGEDDGHAPARKAYQKNGFETSISSIKYYKKL